MSEKNTEVAVADLLSDRDIEKMKSAWINSLPGWSNNEQHFVQNCAVGVARIDFAVRTAKIEMTASDLTEVRSPIVRSLSSACETPTQKAPEDHEGPR